MRRSVGTGLFVGGFLALGVGAAHAEDAGMTTPPPDQPILGSVTELLGGGGPLGGLTSGLGTLTGTTTTYDVPTVSVQTLATPEAKTAPAPAPATTMLATTEADPADGTSAHSMSATPDADLAATSGPASTPDPEPAPTMTTTSTVSSPVSAADCECNLTMGAPTINGAAAGSPGAAQAPAGEPSTVAVPVTNTGGFAVTALAVSGPGGAMDCGTTSLAVDASTTCSGSYAPTSGDQSVPVYATASAPDGDDVSTSGLLFVTGLAGAAGTGGSSTGGTSGGSTGGTSGTPTGTPTGGTTGGSPTGGSPDEDCACLLTSGTPTVGEQPAGAPGVATVAAYEPTTASIPVYNSGDQTVSDLSASSPEGPLTCADGELAPTESTSCSGTIKPEPGDQSVSITVYGTTPDGGSTTTGGVAYVTGSTDGTDGTPGTPGTDGTDGTDGGSTHPTVTPGSNGSYTVVFNGVTYVIQPNGSVTDANGDPITNAPQVTEDSNGSFTIVLNGTTYQVAPDGTVVQQPTGNDGTDGTPGTPGTDGTDGTDSGSTPNDGTDGTPGTPGTDGTDGTDGGSTHPTVTPGSNGSYTVVFNGVTYVIQPNGSVTDANGDPITNAPQVTEDSNGSFTIVLNGTTYQVAPDGTVVQQPTGNDGTDGTPGTPGTDGTDGTDSGSTPNDGTDGTDGGSTPDNATDGTDGQPLTLGAPTVNGQSADGPGDARAEAHKPATVALTVSNTSDEAITDLTAVAGDRVMTCTDTDLAPGESATCTGRIVPVKGAQTTPVEVSAVTDDGEPAVARRSVYLAGMTVVPSGAVPEPESAPQAPAAVGGVSAGSPSTVDVGSAAGSVILGGVPAPTGLQQLVDPSAGAFPMPLGGVGTGGGGTAHLPAATDGQEGEHDVYAWLLLMAGAGAVMAQRVRTSRSH